MVNNSLLRHRQPTIHTFNLQAGYSIVVPFSGENLGSWDLCRSYSPVISQSVIGLDLHLPCIKACHYQRIIHTFEVKLQLTCNLNPLIIKLIIVCFYNQIGRKDPFEPSEDELKKERSRNSKASDGQKYTIMPKKLTAEYSTYM